MTLNIGQLVRFTTNPRFSEWNKRDLAKITDILAEYPYNQSTVYLVNSVANKRQFWVTEAEIEPTFEQLTLF